MFIDVPPIDRAPCFNYARKGPPDFLLEIQEIYTTWNNILHSHTRSFHTKHPDTTILMFSSWDVFSEILDCPGKFGFEEVHTRRAGLEGGMWMDQLHPTSRTHEILADRVKEFLDSFPAYQVTES